MSWHVVTRLPDDRVACADYRDPITPVIRKIHTAFMDGRAPDPALYAAVAGWLAGHAEQSASCHAGLSPAGLPCGHDLPAAASGRQRGMPG
jgi:hypothetical protein